MLSRSKDGSERLGHACLDWTHGMVCRLEYILIDTACHLRERECGISSSVKSNIREEKVLDSKMAASNNVL